MHKRHKSQFCELCAFCGQPPDEHRPIAANFTGYDNSPIMMRLSLLNLWLGLLINFGAPTFKESVKRILNGHTDFADSRLRVNHDTGRTRSREAREGEIDGHMPYSGSLRGRRIRSTQT